MKYLNVRNVNFVLKYILLNKYLNMYGICWKKKLIIKNGNRENVLIRIVGT